MRQFDQTANVDRAVVFVMLIELLCLEVHAMFVLDLLASQEFLDEQTWRRRRGRTCGGVRRGVFAVNPGNPLSQRRELFLKILQAQCSPFLCLL